LIENRADKLVEFFERVQWMFRAYRAAGVRDWVGAPHPGPLPKGEGGRGMGTGTERRPPKPEIQVQAAAQTAERLSRICSELRECTRCRLHTGRSNLVFGEGSAKSGLVFVGEGPGFDEDRLGRPFVGRAGKLLDKMIGAMGFEREEVYIGNVVKCRPPENRTPLPDETAACSPFLFRQIEALGPRVICALGLCAAQTILGSARQMPQLRGKIHFWRGIPVICTYHPAYLLRSPSYKAAAWQDLKEAIKLLRT